MGHGLVLDDHLLDLPEAVTRLRVSARTVERLVERGYLDRIKIFGSTRYRASQIEELVKSGTRGAG